MYKFHYELIDDVWDHCYVLEEQIYIHSLNKDDLNSNTYQMFDKMNE